jgi:uncharacterized RDD family membrane protein YckC
MDKYQTIGARFLALIIDAIVLLPIGFVSSFFMAVFGNTISVVYISQFFSLSLVVLYSIVLHAKYGQTLGKKVCSVKVFDISESEITLQQSIIRSSPQLVQLLLMVLAQASYFSSGSSIDQTIISYGVPIYAVLYVGWNIADIIVALSNDKHRALHDYISGTVVIKTN